MRRRETNRTLYRTSAHVFLLNKQQQQHGDTIWVACNITTTMTMKMRRLADVDHHARGRELRGVSTSPEARG